MLDIAQIRRVFPFTNLQVVLVRRTVATRQHKTRQRRMRSR